MRFFLISDNSDAMNGLRLAGIEGTVARSEADLRQALGVYQLYRPKCAVYVGAVFGKIEPRRIVEFMKDPRLTDWHMQLQLHKIIWNPDDRGV